MSSVHTGHVWHKGSEKQPWMRKFVIVKDSVVRIYGTRNDHAQQKEALVALELITDTTFRIGSDNVCHIGWMTKKGIINWNPRWCILLRTGYISYVDADAKHEVRSIDLLNATIQAQLEPQLQLNIKGSKSGSLFQFRLDNKKEFQEWYAKITEVQKECARVRKEYSGGNQPTLFPFMIIKEYSESNSDNEEKSNNNNNNKKKLMRPSKHRICHYFCCDSEDGLYEWQRALEANIAIKQLSLSNNNSMNNNLDVSSISVNDNNNNNNNNSNSNNNDDKAGKPPKSDNLPISGSPSLTSRRPGNSSNFGTPKGRSSKITARSAMARLQDAGADGKKLVSSLTSRMSIGNGIGSASAGSKSEDENDSDEDAIGPNTPNEIIDKQFARMVKDLRLPASAATNMLKLPKAQKIQMLQAKKVKEKGRQRESGRVWAEKFAANRGVNANTLQTFGVVLRDENERFVKDFISELGLNHLCRLGNKSNITVDKELLNVFKAIIDTEGTTTSLINHDLVVRLIVQKVDSKDAKVRELALQLLVSLVAVDTDVTAKAVSDIMSSLQDQASLHGTRNRWKPLLSHLSVKDVYYGTVSYDNLCVTLINFLLSSIDSVEERIEERRLLNGEHFDKILRKLEDKMHRTSMRGDRNEIASLQTQIETYFALAKEDSRATNITDEDDDNLDLSDPKELFDRVQKQALEDGYINELTRILSNLVTLPASAGGVWYNVSRIVGEACQPIQTKMLKNSDYGRAVTKTARHGATAVDPHLLIPGSAIETRVAMGSVLFNNNEDYFGLSVRKDSSSNQTHYPNYQALKHLLKVKEQEDEKEGPGGKVGAQLKEELENERNKVLKLEKELETLTRQFDELRANPASISHSTVVIQQPKDGSVSTNGGANDGSGGVTKGPGFANAGEALKAALAAKQGGNAAAKDDAKNAEEASASSAAPAKDDGYNKYRKMLKMMMPKQSVANRMRQDGIDASIIEDFEESGVLPNGNAMLGGSGSAAAAGGGISSGASKAGAAAALMAHLGNKGGGGAAGGKSEGGSSGGKAGELTAEEEQKVAKYRRMLKIHMPQQSVINRMRQDGVDKALIDKMFGSGSASSGLDGDSGGASGKKKKKEEPKLPPNLKPKPVINPAVKMRNLHWNPVNPFDVEKTIWNDINDESIKLETKALESKFCWKEIERKTQEEDMNAKKSNKKEVVTVLDTKRAYNVEIFLGRIKLDNWEIRKAMLAMDELKLPKEKVDKFINFVPTPAEAASLEGYEDEPNLGKAETFFKILKSVDSNLKQRLELWSFKMQFNESLQIEKEKIIALKKGSQCLQNSKSFKKVLTIILAIGNYMNGGTKKGQAYGFKIGSLTQLHRSRTVDNQQTLLEYLYEFLNAKYSDTTSFVNDLKPLDSACKVDIPAMRVSMQQIGAKLNLIGSRLKAGSKKMDDRFVEVMAPFHERAVKEYEQVKTLQNSVQKELNEIGIWLNEPKDINCEYLKSINQFRKDFIQTEKTVIAKKEKAAKEAERAKRMAQKKQARKSKKLGVGGGASASASSSQSGLSSTTSSPGASDDESSSMSHMKPHHRPQESQNLSDQILQGLQRTTNTADFMARLAQRRQKLNPGTATMAQAAN